MAALEITFRSAEQSLNCHRGGQIGKHSHLGGVAGEGRMRTTRSEEATGGLRLSRGWLVGDLLAHPASIATGDHADDIAAPSSIGDRGMEVRLS